MSNLKSKTYKGLFWSSLDKFSVQGLSFIFGIILARLISPSDYGLIGMLSVFISLGQVFVASNFMTALIHKQDRTSDDFNTVFIFNIGIALLFYLILYFSADLIADFYSEPKLSMLTRVISLNIVLYSLSFVQITIFTIELDFRRQAIISVISVILSGIIGIAFAIAGYGAWALVWRTILGAGISSFGLWIISSWRPNYKFSIQSFKELFAFSSKLLLGDLFDAIYRNINNVLIGKFYGAESIGYYLRAKQLQDLPSVSITEITQKVTFPILSTIQNDDERLAFTFKKIICFTSYIVIGLMFLLMTVAKPLIVITLTEKWLKSVEIFQILCFAGIWFPINFISMNAIVVKGKTGLFLKIDLIKKILSLVLVLVAVQFSVITLAYSMVVIALLSFVINAYYTDRTINYRFFDQIKDILPFLIIGYICSLCSRYLMDFFNYEFMQLITGSVLFSLAFLLISWKLNLSEFNELVIIAKKVWQRIIEIIGSARRQ